LWPPGDPDFRHTVTAYHTATTNFARQLLGAMAWALGLDARYFEAKVIEPLAHLRLWKYPPTLSLHRTKIMGF
jgi:isopenicillin N synthase-like dioxygenase